MSAPLRLVFLGSDALAIPVLDSIADGPASPATVVGVYTQPDRPHGRGQRIEPGAIKQWAERRGLPVFQPDRLGADDATGVRDRLRADVALVMAYGLLLKDEMLSAPRLGTFNVHTSILPRFRGASPIATAVASGVSETGVSFMRLVRKLDAGPVADSERVPVGPRDTAADVTSKLAAAAVPLVIRSLRALEAGTLAPREQDESAATYCRRLSKADGALDFSRPARELAARINGLFPWPGCSVAIGDTPVKLGLADVEGEGAVGVPGSVLDLDSEAIRIATGSGVLRLFRLQRPGGRMLPATEFLRGFAIPGGTVLPSAPMAPLESSQPFPRV
ncbi:MAG TPA: methionyl-tRNA formyltransferase [Opitutaceae bacterium]|nr:methionyl-tRNA formyltransferase [Opitutaceae bacterium]